MKGRILFSMAVGVIFLSTAFTSARAETDAEVILRALIRKGILTQADINAATSEVGKTKMQDDSMASSSLKDRVSALEKQAEKSKWVSKMTTKGDLRARFDMVDKPQGESNNRARIRFRWGVTAEVNDQTEIGFGLASGSNDSPTSTNQTLEEAFQSKPVWIDYAYAKYTPVKDVELYAGKFNSPFYHTDMLWDADIRFDGFAVKAHHDVPLGDIVPDNKLFMSAGFFPIDDSAAGQSDLSMTAIQLGTKGNVADLFKVKTAVAFYNFTNMEGHAVSALAEGKSTNTTAAGGTALNNDFSIVTPIIDITLSDVFGLGIPLSGFYEYAENVIDHNEDDNKAFRAGFKLNKGGKKKGDWMFRGQYSKLESDVFPDSFPDASFNSGGTNAKGWRFTTTYGVLNNTVLGVDYFNTKANTGAENNEQVLYLDIVWFF